MRGLAGLAVCAALPACLSAPPSSTGDADPIPADAPVLETGCGDPVFEDRFSDPDLDEELWTPSQGGLGAVVGVIQGVLHLEANPAGSGYAFAKVEGVSTFPMADHVAYITTSNDFSGTGRAFFGWLVVPSDALMEPVYLGLEASADEDGTIVRVRQQGMQTQSIVTSCDGDCTAYDPGIQRVWQIRATGGTLGFYTSSDSVTWTTVLEGHELPGPTGTLALWSDCDAGSTRAFVEEVRLYDCSE